MANIPENKKQKRPSKGIRKHIRRLKQEGRKENISQAELKKRIRQ